jgi:hypothetical protein
MSVVKLAVVTRRSDVEYLYSGSTLVLSNGRNELCLSRFGRWVWELCDGSRSSADIIGLLERRWTLPALSLEQRVASMLTAFVDKGFAHQQTERERAESGDWPVPRSTTFEVDWSRVARVQADGYDTEVIRCESLKRGRIVIRDPAAPCIPGMLIRVGHCYRDLIPPRLTDAEPSHPSLMAVARYVDQWPEIRHQVNLLVGTVHPVIDPLLPSRESAFLTGSMSHSIEELPGTLVSSINCPIMLSLNMVHELAHQKLFELGVYKGCADRFLLNATDRCYSPIKDTERPISAVLHGVFAFLHVLQLELKLLRSWADEAHEDRRDEIDQPRQLINRAKRNVLRVQTGLSELKRNAKTDTAGTEFLAGLCEWGSCLADELCDVSAMTESTLVR